ncbi:MAG: hypothetical protein QOI97_1340, partial [Pseudomonas sp.]|nr:hypothetical protein [Pseudomonas sp.]
MLEPSGALTGAAFFMCKQSKMWERACS